MSDDALAYRRWLTLTLVRLFLAADAVFGLMLIGRATTLLPKLIGMGLVLGSLLMMALIPRALTRRWRTPPLDRP